jgi:hypothetical protein
MSRSTVQIATTDEKVTVLEISTTDSTESLSDKIVSLAVDICAYLPVARLALHARNEFGDARLHVITMRRLTLCISTG